MKMIFISILLILLFSCTNEDKINNSNLNVRNDLSSNQAYLDIAKNLLAPAIGEWSYNHSLVTGINDWSLVVKDSVYILNCRVLDFNSQTLSWGLKSTVNGGIQKLNCSCGTISGTNGKCVSKSDWKCYKDTQNGCELDCISTLTDMSNWGIYFDEGISIINYLDLPILTIFFEN